MFLILVLTSIVGSTIYRYYFLYNEYLLKIVQFSGGLILTLYFASIIDALAIRNINKYKNLKLIDKIAIYSIVITMIQFTKEKKTTTLGVGRVR